jgi:surface polysaccharide O-acyltransferase-like enzyme
MEKNKTERLSNFELMRIISMFFIVLFHVRMHSEIASKALGNNYLILEFITNIIVVHVNSFILISGYFQSKSNIKVSKAISLINSVWFYKTVFMILAIILVNYTSIKLIGDFSTINKFKTFLPLDFGIYWYIDSYLVLYLISPLLNKIINNITKEEFKRIILVLLLLICIIPTLTVDEVIRTNNGHSLISFILLYFIGAYLRIYPVKDNYYFKRLTEKARQSLFFIMIPICSIAIMFCCIVAQRISAFGPITAYLGQVLEMNYLNYTSPLILIESIVYFLFFETLTIKSKFINKISKYMFGIYLIHENPFVYENLYNYLGLTSITNVTIKTIIMIIIISIIIFIICLIIEIIRQTIFKFIYKRKISKKFRDTCKNYFKNIGLGIN